MDLKQKIEELETDPVTGKTKKVKKLVNVVAYDPNKESIYARFFDETCDNWSKTPEYNLIFLKAKQSYANNMLHARGHLFLNEVYDDLGIPRSQAGQEVGWFLNKNGDNYVSFGLTDVYRETSHNFVNGHERSVLLDFNVDGPIAHLIEEKKNLEGTGLGLVGSGNP